LVEGWLGVIFCDAEALVRQRLRVDGRAVVGQLGVVEAGDEEVA